MTYNLTRVSDFTYSFFFNSDASNPHSTNHYLISEMLDNLHSYHLNLVKLRGFTSNILLGTYLNISNRDVLNQPVYQFIFQFSHCQILHNHTIESLNW